MGRRSTVVAASMVVGLSLTVSVSSVGSANEEAAASSYRVSNPSRAVVNGQLLSANDGLEVVTESYDVDASHGEVGVVYSPDLESGAIPALARWGSSYAISKEIAQLRYKGRAKAAGNVVNKKRIVKVCIWYTRAGKVLTKKACSSANSNGGKWGAGKEATVSVNDTLNPRAPKTKFNIQTTRINPKVA